MLVHFGLDLGELFVGNRAGMAKIETQAVGSHQRSRLAHVLPQLLAQDRVQNMRRRMIEHGFSPTLAIDHELYFVADLKPAFYDLTAMGGELRRWVLCVYHFDEIAARGSNSAAVADLTTGLTIKWRLGG